MDNLRLLTDWTTGLLLFSNFNNILKTTLIIFRLILLRCIRIISSCNHAVAYIKLSPKGIAFDRIRMCL